MSQAVYNTNIVANGISFPESQTINSDGAVLQNPTLGPAQPGQLTTRGSSTAGTLTMTNSNHGITTGARLDIYWAGGQCYGATVGTVSGTSVPFTGGTALPALNTLVTAMVPTKTGFNALYASLQGLFVGGNCTGYAVFADTSSALIVAVLISATLSYDWNVNNGAANPFGTTNCVYCWLSHGDANASHVMNALALITP